MTGQNHSGGPAFLPLVESHLKGSINGRCHYHGNDRLPLLLEDFCSTRNGDLGVTVDIAYLPFKDTPYAMCWYVGRNDQPEIVNMRDLFQWDGWLPCKRWVWAVEGKNSGFLRFLQNIIESKII